MMDVRFIILNCKKYIFVADFSLSDLDIALDSLRIWVSFVSGLYKILQVPYRDYQAAP